MEYKREETQIIHKFALSDEDIADLISDANELHNPSPALIEMCKHGSLSYKVGDFKPKFCDLEEPIETSGPQPQESEKLDLQDGECNNNLDGHVYEGYKGAMRCGHCGEKQKETPIEGAEDLE